jgi:hypothetical protein
MTDRSVLPIKDSQESKVKLIMKLHGLDNNSCDLLFSILPDIENYSEERIIDICAAVINGSDKMKDVALKAKNPVPQGEIGFSEIVLKDRILSDQFSR